MLNASQEGADGIQYRQDRDLVNNQLSTQKEGEVNGDSTRVMPSSSLSSEECTSMNNSSHPSWLTVVTPSTAARAREKQLLDDPMAIVLGPLCVDCKGCGKRIKLSTKSLYDLSHWRTHRARCLKRQPHLLKKPSSKLDLGISELSLRRSEKPGMPLNPPDVEAPAIFESRSPSLHSSVLELPLTPSDTSESVINKGHALLPKLSITPPVLATALPLTPTNVNNSRDHPSPLSKASSHLLPADVVFADYLLRSNRQMVLSTSTIQPRWQDWTWDQLRLPQFQALDHDSPNDVFPSNDAARSLSLLAHS